MTPTLPKATSQRNDYIGTSAIDWHIGTDLHEIAEAKGIDTKRYVPVSLEIVGFDPWQFTIHAVDGSETGVSVDSIVEYAKEHDGVVPIVSFDFSATIEELSWYIKRFIALVTNRNIKGVTGFIQVDRKQL